MTVEIFDRETFEGVLNTSGLKFVDRGWNNGEREYAIILASHARIVVRSSIHSDGQSAAAGQDSIRIYLSDDDGRPLVAKAVTGQERWIARTTGWQTRLLSSLDRLRLFHNAMGTCSCGYPRVALVSKTTRNPGRVFTKCSKCGQWGSWLNVDGIEKQESMFGQSPIEKAAPAIQKLASLDSYVTSTVTGLVGLAGDAEIPTEKEPTPQKDFTPSPFQQAIRDFVLNQSQALRVEAYAGSGKTSTNAFVCRAIEPSRGKVKMMVFAKANQLDMQAKIPDWIPATTTHSAGFSDIRRQFHNVRVDEHKTLNLFKSAFENNYDVRDNYPAVAKLVSLCKNTLSLPDDNSLDQLCERYDVQVNGDRGEIYDAVERIYRDSMESIQSVIDFDDMLFAPASGMVPVEKCDLLFVDECLPYHTPVLLSDGSSLDIGDIVEGKINTKVLSYNTQTGKQEPCEITAWHKIVNQKPLVKIKAKWTKRVGTNNPTSFVVCTTDHKIWSDGKWIEAGNLKPGETIQVETSATKSQSYKITSRGRVALSIEMSRKNNSEMKRNDHHGIIVKRGGNGRELTLPQKLLLECLGKGWIPEYPIPTKKPRNSGYPTCYKSDIANPDLKVAIEIDGHGHNWKENKKRDAKKDQFLRSIGWMTFRFKNEHVVQRTQEISDSIYHQINDCPIDAKVISVEPVQIPDYFVYDITIKKCHDFYANGILVHNCQDTNSAQQSYYLKTGARIVFVGDANQAIYGFRGAMIGAMDRMQKLLSAAQLPLPISYRCDKAIIALAQTIVPQIQARPDAADGLVKDCTDLRLVKPGDMVLCRNNAPLVKPCFELIRSGIKATIKGRDIGSNLMTLVRKVEKKSHAFDFNGLLGAIQDYTNAESMKLDRQHRESQAASLRDQCDTIMALAEDCSSVASLDIRVKKIFSDEVEGVSFGTIHKNKGAESNRVFILKPELLTPQKYDTMQWQLDQLSNLTYVAYTRAKHELYFVHEKDNS